MNRQAAVLAADSASTVSRWVDGKMETRYFKGANKIFQLSNFQPVGLMIFDSAELLHVPWELLIKGFREHLAKKTFNSLEGYAAEFFSFLDGNATFFPEGVQKDSFYSAVQTAALQLVFRAFSDLKTWDELRDEAKQRTLDAAIVARGHQLDEMQFPARLTEGQQSETIAAHLEPICDRLGALLPLPTEIQKELATVSIKEVFKTPSEWFGTAGLVFAGYGDHDIFPEMIEYRSSGMIIGTQVFEERSRSIIDHTLPAALHAFAQTSMSDTFTIGFSEDIYGAFMKLLSTKIREFASGVCESIGTDLGSVKNLDELVRATEKKISEELFESARREHSYPLRRVLGVLPVDEMAELAETLVNLQSLKEKVTKPSASVGGPIDVAIITKHEGLVWIKRKKYFDMDENPRYAFRQQSLYRA